MADGRGRQVLGRRRAAATVGILIAAGAGVLALHPARADEPHPGPYYRSVAQMADLTGCSRTLRPVALVGPVWDAGDCTTPDGIQVQFRMFDNGDQATGWGSAMRETDTGPIDAIAYGNDWAVRVIDADRDQANRIFAHLT